MKYIIEIEEEPFGRNDDPVIPHGMDELYRAKGFNALVFDKHGLDKLTPLNKELEEAYQKGYNEAKLIYQNPNAESDYQRGLDDAWEAAYKIVCDVKLDSSTLLHIFKTSSFESIFGDFSASKAIAKLKAYEESQKPDEIKVGDEVKCRADDCGVVTWIYGNDAYVLWQDGSTGNYAANELVKTGRHFNFLTSLLNAMKEGAE